MEKIILPKDDESAKFVNNISGWVSRRGRFYGADERIARWDGSTHVECTDCQTVISKGRMFCDKCADKRDSAKHAARELAEWDEKGMLYSDAADEFFRSWDEVYDHCEECFLNISDLRLVICEPVFLHQIDADEWCDDLHEDGELPLDIEKALEAFNAVVRASKPVSWVPGKKAAIVPKDEASE